MNNVKQHSPGRVPNRGTPLWRIRWPGIIRTRGLSQHRPATDAGDAGIETHPSRYDCSESLATSSLRLSGSLLVIAQDSPNRAGVHETDSTCPSSRYKVRPASFSNRFPGKCRSPHEPIAPLTTRQESRRVLPVNPSLVTRLSSALFDHQSLMISPHY